MDNTDKKATEEELEEIEWEPKFVKFPEEEAQKQTKKAWKGLFESDLMA